MLLIVLECKVSDRNRINGYDFDIEAMTSFEGDTGPYLQYSHARLCSIIKKAGVSDNTNANLSLLIEPHATNLVRTLAQFPDVVQFTMKTLEPTNILTYLFHLTHSLNSSYDVLRVVGSPEEVMKARLQLFRSTRDVLNHGMRLLGLSPVDRYALAKFSPTSLTGLLRM
jgi:arginyl-tRNA synthetase